MKDNFDYLTLYPKEFLVAFGYQTREQRAESTARRAATKVMRGMDENQADVLDQLGGNRRRFNRTHCKYKHPASQFGFINSEGYQRCRKCLRDTNKRYEQRKQKARAGLR